MPAATMDELKFTSPLEITAGEAKGKPTRFRLNAYTGKPMNVEGFYYPVIVDLEGVAFDQDVTPIIADHDVTKRIGHTTTQTIDAKGIRAEGIVSASGEVAEAFVNDARNGIPFQCSIGAIVNERQIVPQGEEATVNGQVWKGPLIVAKRSTIREISIVLLGADPRSSAAIVASKAGSNSHVFRKEPTMTATQTADPVQAERSRIKAIHDMLSPPEGRGWQGVEQNIQALMANAIEGSVPLADIPRQLRDIVELQDLRLSRPNPSPSGPFIHAARPTNSPEVLEAVLLCKAGQSRVAEKSFAAPVLEAANTMRSLSFPEICRAALSIENRDVPHSREAMIKAAFSTNALTNALGGGMDKLLHVTFMEAGATWRSFAAMKPLSNFREHTLISPQHRGQLLEVDSTAELKHGWLSEDTSTIRLSTFAKLVGVSRRDVINDNLGIFDEVGQVLSVQAMRKLNDLVYETILANAGSHFHADNGNLLTGGGSALSITSLSNAVTAMRKQKDVDNNDLDIRPKVLVVPPELETTARQILQSIEVMRTADQSPTGNALKDIAVLEVEPRLSNTAKFTGAATTHWYLLSGPTNAPVYVATLDGKLSPNVEAFGLDSDINHLQYSWRVYADWGCSLGSPESAVRSVGA
jgi:hypothetical protein